jgi:hypothetical protein
VTYPQRIGLLLISVAFSLAGCDRDESSVRTYSAPKDVPPSPPTPMLADASASPAADVASTESPGPLRWTLPVGWKQVGGSSEMRYATIDVAPGTEGGQLTITPLGPEAAALLPNVVRWAGQLGIAGVTEADLPKYSVDTQISGEPAHIIDITGQAAEGKPAMRLLAAIIPHDGKTWFVKLTAPQSIAAAQKSNFETFLHSLQFVADQAPPSLSGASQQPPGAPQKPEAQSSFRLAAWKTPDGWTEQPGANAMRVTSFRVGSGPESAEVIVSRIPQDNAGSFLDNINRWRGQVGLEPVADQKPGDMKTVIVAGHQALFLSFAGPGAAGDKQIIVSMDLEGPDFWFVKMLGPASIVSAQQDAFRQFLASMQFVPEPH